MLKSLKDFIADKAWGKAADLVISVAAKSLGKSVDDLNIIVKGASISLSI